MIRFIYQISFFCYIKKSNTNEQLYFTGVQFLRLSGAFLGICKNTYLMMLFEYTNKEFMDWGVPGGEFCCANCVLLDTCSRCKLTPIQNTRELESQVGQVSSAPLSSNGNVVMCKVLHLLDCHRLHLHVVCLTKTGLPRRSHATEQTARCRGVGMQVIVDDAIINKKKIILR